jgi:hypothetical protein
VSKLYSLENKKCGRIKPRKNMEKVLIYLIAGFLGELFGG